MDLEKIAHRSKHRVMDWMDPSSPFYNEKQETVFCPFCIEELTVRFSQLGHLQETDSGKTPYIEGVRLKCTGDSGCGLIIQFDTPICKRRGCWHELSGQQEYNRELKLRDGSRGIDFGYDQKKENIEDRLRQLGYLE